MEIGVNVIEVFHESNLVAVSTKQGRELLVIHTAKDCALTNLEAVEMKDWQDGTRLFWIYVLDPVPGANEELSEMRRIGR